MIVSYSILTHTYQDGIWNSIKFEKSSMINYNYIYIYIYIISILKG